MPGRPALGIRDHVDLLLFSHEKSTGMNFHKIVGEEPCRGLAVALIVRGIEPNVVENGDRAG